MPSDVLMLPQAYAAKLSALHERQELKHSLWDKLVFNKIKRELGFDRMRIMCTGRQATCPEVHEAGGCRFSWRSPWSLQGLRRCVCLMGGQALRPWRRTCWTSCGSSRGATSSRAMGRRRPRP